MNRILITSAIPYINGIKHLGNLVGSQLPSDLYARYMRLRGHEVMFICATDEHGTPAELAALKANKPVEEYCREMHEEQKKLANDFRLSFDYFGRSSSQRNHVLTQHFAEQLAQNGFISEVEEEQIYSFTDKRFLPDRYVQGICPNCGYENARGDQCENCTKQLSPTDLINPRSAISGSIDLEVRKTKHLYLRQSLFRKKLEEWIDLKKDWPILTTSIAKKWLFDDEGLQDRSITRDLDWGIPVKKGAEPWPGMENKVFYVWFDAPIEYIAATAEWADANGKSDAEWERWWRLDKGAEDVRYVQFMGKDNVPFHTLSFPVTIMGSGEPWKLVDKIKSFNYLNYEGGQFSTSLVRGIFMNQALEILQSDYWRWWLLSHAPEYSDSDFTWDDFCEGISTDLTNVLGNFVSRVTKFCSSHFGNKIPENHGWTDLEQKYTTLIEQNLVSYQEFMDDIEIRKASQSLRKIWTLGNEYIQEAAPWGIVKTDKSRAATILNYSLNLIRFFGNISSPFIPDTSDYLLGLFDSDYQRVWPENVNQALKSLQTDQKFRVPENIFKKFSKEDADRMKKDFNWRCLISELERYPKFHNIFSRLLDQSLKQGIVLPNYQAEINPFYNDKFYTPNSLCELYNLILKHGGEYPKWKGHRVLAINHSRIDLPIQLVDKGYTKPKINAHYTQVLVSYLIRTGDDLPVTFSLSSKVNNVRKPTEDHFTLLQKNDILIFGRGYFSFKLFYDLHRRGVKTVFRLQNNSGKVFRDFINSDKFETIIDAKGQQTTQRDLKRHWPNETLKPVPTRLIRHNQGEEDVILATTFVESSIYTANEIINLYHRLKPISELHENTGLSDGVNTSKGQDESEIHVELHTKFILSALIKLYTPSNNFQIP